MMQSSLEITERSQPQCGVVARCRQDYSKRKVLWCIPVIPPVEEAEVGGLWFKAGQTKAGDPI
jgi:hypothetical protein